ncbi:alcohol dehydrogenase catalytic domain-containing protein [Cupriavidus basilensis]
MRAFQVDQAWSMDNVKIATRTIPTPGSGQVRLKMSAAALNYRDLIIPMRGYGRRMQDLPLILLSDGVGIVDAIGAGASGVALGDRVCPIFYQTWLAGEPNNETMLSSLGCEQDGTMAEYMVVPAEGCAMFHRISRILRPQPCLPLQLPLGDL